MQFAKNKINQNLYFKNTMALSVSHMKKRHIPYMYIYTYTYMYVYIVCVYVCVCGFA